MKKSLAKFDPFGPILVHLNAIQKEAKSHSSQFFLNKFCFSSEMSMNKEHFKAKSRTGVFGPHISPTLDQIGPNFQINTEMSNHQRS